MEYLITPTGNVSKSVSVRLNRVQYDVAKMRLIEWNTALIPFFKHGTDAQSAGVHIGIELVFPRRQML